MTRNTHMAVIGTYSAATSPGVHTVAVDANTGALDQLDSVVAGPDPTFVASHPNDEYIYVAVRTEPEGVIKAFEVDTDTGELSLVNSVESGALSPCHCSVDATGEFLFVAHYAGGAVSMLPLESDGAVAAPTAVREHSGSSIDPDRQTSPHPHSANPGPDNDYLYVPDLGTDQIVVYKIRPAAGDIVPHRTIDLAPGSGPRHLSFSPDGESVYLVNELDSTVTVFERTSGGNLTKQSNVSTLPADFEGENKTAEIEVHPSGRYVFASNRGRDTIVTFAVDGDELRRTDETPTGGKWPRHFSVDPTGERLFVENKNTDEIVVFDIDVEAGEMSRTSERLVIGDPVCMRWI